METVSTTPERGCSSPRNYSAHRLITAAITGMLLGAECGTRAIPAALRAAVSCLALVAVRRCSFQGDPGYGGGLGPYHGMLDVAIGAPHHAHVRPFLGAQAPFEVAAG